MGSESPKRIVSIDIDNPPQKAVEAMADALHSIAVKHAADSVKIDDMLLRKYILCFREAVAANDRSCAIIVFAMTEEIILSIIKNHLRKSDKDTLNSLFGANGIIATSYAKLTVAYAFGWISKDTYNKVTILKNIRNAFAHHMDVSTFQSEVIQKKLINLDNYPLNKLHDLLISIENSELSDKRFEIIKNDYLKKDKRMYLLCAFSNVKNLVIELAVWPYARENRVHPKSILDEIYERNKGTSIMHVFAQIQLELINCVLPNDLKLGLAREGEEVFDLAPKASMAVS